MLRVENMVVSDFMSALRGMRNPLESWEKSDSWLSIYQNALHPFASFKPEEHDVLQYIGADALCMHLGENDLKLAQRLVRAGSDHSKFMRQINVSMDIIAPLYWWKEMDTYKVATVSNSCSTMHKLSTTPITRECFSFDNIDEDLLIYPNDGGGYHIRDFIDGTIEDCERLRILYLETKDVRYWRALIQLLPESWEQKRTWSANYAVVRAIRNSDRKHHKLTEWHQLLAIFDMLPYAKELLINEQE